MKFRLLIGLIMFILLEGSLIVYALREIDQLTDRMNIPAFKWKLTLVLGILGIGILAGLFSAGLFLIFEIGMIWVLLPVLLAGLIVYLLIRRKLLRRGT